MVQSPNQMSGVQKEVDYKDTLFHFRHRTEMSKIGWAECNQIHSGEVKLKQQ